MMLYQAPWQKRLESLGYCEVFGLSTAGAVLAGSGISSAGSLAGGKKASNAATQASQLQAQYLQQALQFQESVYQNNANNLNPYIQFGTAGIPALQTAVNAASTPFQPTQAQLSGMPGYQWVQNQTQAQLANQGSVTGPGGAVNYQKLVGGAGVASTYENQFFNQWLQGNQLNLAAAATPVQTGLSAAGALAGINVSGIASTMGNIGTALASGITGSANALTAGLSGATSAAGSGLSNIALLNALGSTGQQVAYAQPSSISADYGGGGDVGTPAFNQG